MTRRALLGALPLALVNAKPSLRNDVALKGNEVRAAFTAWASAMNAAIAKPGTLPADAVVAFGSYASKFRELERLFWRWARG